MQGCAGIGPQGLQQSPQPPGVGQYLQQQLAEADLPAAAVLQLVELGPGCFDQLVVAHAGRAGGHAGVAAQAGVEMAGDGGVQLQFTGFDRPQSMNASTGRVHFAGQHPVTGAGG